MAKKFFLDLTIESIEHLRSDLLWLCLRRTDNAPMPPMKAGQFVELQIPTSKALLNRPISIFDYSEQSLELLVKVAGISTGALAGCLRGNKLRAIVPIGHGFSISSGNPLLIAGGVGIAPIYFLAKAYKSTGKKTVLIYGERTAPPADLYERLSSVADIKICTDDGSVGFHGLVTQHPYCATGGYSIIQTCGPLPMMKAVASLARTMNLDCEVSLENRMACGLGACLCCVENTHSGHKCVCTDGPVFNTKELLW